MIEQRYVQTLARYNRWQNRSLYAAAATLTDDQRRQDCGAFFGSIDATLRHLLWADNLWLSRFTDHPAPIGRFPEATASFQTFADLNSAREAMDLTLLAWAEAIDPAWLSSDVTWVSALLGGERTQVAALLVTHMFNHQTHHRGQIHAMLTRLGAKPEDTDMIVMPKD